MGGYWEYQLIHQLWTADGLQTLALRLESVVINFLCSFVEIRVNWGTPS